MTPSAAQAGGTLSILVHGLSVLDFAANGESMDVRWLAFDREPGCDIPMHLPKLHILQGTAIGNLPNPCHVAGLHLTPDVPVSGGLDAKSYKDTIQNMVEHPAGNKPQDWENLKWIPRFPDPVDFKTLGDKTIARLSLTTGTLRGTVPFNAEARRLLWALAKPSEYEADKNLPGLKRHAMTDQVLYTVPFTGDRVSLRCTSVLSPGASFTLDFKPVGDEVILLLDADATLPGEPSPTDGMVNYCTYYQVVKPAAGMASVAQDARRLPYRVGEFSFTENEQTLLVKQFPQLTYLADFQKKHRSHAGSAGVLSAAAAGTANAEQPHSGQTSPDPYCGSFRVVRDGVS